MVPELIIFLMVFLVLRGYQNGVFMVLSFHISDGISILGDEESLFLVSIVYLLTVFMGTEGLRIVYC